MFPWFHKFNKYSVSSECDINGLPLPPAPPISRPPSSLIQAQSDYDTLSEKYWGEILERTVSSSSLQTLQRTYDQSIINTSSLSTTTQHSKPISNGQQVCEYCA